MTTESDYFEMNRVAWDERADVHVASRFYDVDGFLSGNSSLTEIELAELPDVSGLTLLHLQCHFGLDTLSWARMGARCTGVDISAVAIEHANRLRDQTNLAADFVCSNVYDFDRGSRAPFDIVYTSFGTICWLPDLTRWAEVIAANLATGGTFYMAEFHPIYDLLSGYSYFTPEQPDVETEGTYTENGSEAIAEMATWAHAMSSVVNALVNAGIEVLQLNEYDFSPYNCFDGLKEKQPGRFYLDHRGHNVPLVFSLLGRKNS